MSSIEIVNLRKTYPRQARPAIADVNLAVRSGGLLALLGLSGCGKSTLLKLIAGIETSDAGDIVIDGRSILATPPHRRGAVLMFQKAYLFPFLSVAENIGFGLTIQRASQQTIAAEVGRMLALVELPGIERERPARLSGGEQQRVALARALVVRPRVLLLDEPFSSLDAAVRQTLQAAVSRIQHELGTTTILVTHDRGEALAMADDVALLDRGALLASGPPQQIFQRPPTRRAARLLGITTFIVGQRDGSRLHTPLGTLAVEPDATSGSALYAIRPEHLVLGAPPGGNTLPARLVGQTFRGEQSEIQLSVGGEIWRALAPQPLDLPAGTSISVGLPPARLFPLLDDESPAAA